LEPLAGYLRLAERLCAEDGERFAKAWNFGSDVPATIDATVGEVAEIAARLWGRGGWKVDCSSPIPPCAESPALRLDSSLARRELGWRPRWTLGQALERTVGWYKAYWARKDMYQFTLDQIKDYA
jgi:CDP-glucose 4,6-dehydratase